MAVNKKNFLGLLLLLCAYSARGGGTQLSVVHLNEDNWHDILKGEWMVEFMAPWCPACRAFQETWDSFAKKWSKDLEIRVAVVDITKNPGLNGRFLVTALPSIYHIKDSQFRQYTGSRSEDDLIKFIDDKKWKDLEQVSKWIAPDSMQMNLVAQLFKFAMTVRAFYTFMVEYGIPEWGCYAIFAVITIVTGLVLGLVLVCICDFMYPQKQYRPLPAKGVMNVKIDKERELNDNTQEDDGDTKVRCRNVHTNDEKTLEDGCKENKDNKDTDNGADAEEDNGEYKDSSIHDTGGDTKKDN